MPPGASSTVAADKISTLNSLRVPWLPLGYFLVFALLAFRLAYIGSGTIELSKDEAYQWLWSKHLALSYYSKPPGIALIQFAGTSLWGDTQFGVRFFSPVCAAILSLVMLRFMAREAGARQAFLLLLIVTCVPLMGIGTILMTIDPPLVLFWMLAVLTAWRAAKADGKARHWLVAGLATGLGFLCKYNALYLLLCWALFFWLWKPARVHLKTPGPYLALLVIALCALPVIIWNAQHGWITARHVADNAAISQTWRPKRFFDFTFTEFALLNPIFFIGAIWAAIGFWKKGRNNPLWLYFFCMGAPVFLGHWLYSLHSRVQPNWIAPSVVPLCCLMLVYWDERWREGQGGIKGWLVAGLALGLLMLVPMHQSNVIGRLVGHPLPGEMDPLRRVRAWKETSAEVESARKELLKKGKAAFIITDHYGMAGEFSFYLPEARAALRGEPLVYPYVQTVPGNQFYFWPEYQYVQTRKGQNAIYIVELDPYTPTKGWILQWLKGEEIQYEPQPAVSRALPASVREAFENISALGLREIKVDGQVLRRVQLFECLNAK